ncbi:MAG: hypothetical protein N3F66_06740 [Spirochaetes bacterium]|nr:hypothetical protein [Spirochaetota bacterium]
MNNDTLVDLTTIRELREVETALRNEIQAAKSDIIRDLQKKEEYLTHLIRVLIAKVDALEQERKEVHQEMPKTNSRRLFRL